VACACLLLDQAPKLKAMLTIFSLNNTIHWSLETKGGESESLLRGAGEEKYRRIWLPTAVLTPLKIHKAVSLSVAAQHLTYTADEIYSTWLP